MKLNIRILAVALFAFSMASCSNDSDESMSGGGGTTTTTTFNATLNKNGEVPPTTSDATGYATLVFNNTTKVFTLNVTFSGLTPTDAHIHKGAVGVSGPPVFPLSDLTSPIGYTSPALTAEQETDLKANLYYINLHTALYPLGEIRGQLIKQGTSGGGGGGGGGGGY